MRLSSLANDFVIQIDDVDISKPLEDEMFNSIREVWMEHRVAVFPKQTLNDDQLVRFTERFGALFVHAQSSLLTTFKRKEVMELSNLDVALQQLIYPLKK